MADRFPSLEDFDSGVQTDDVQNSAADISADDFLAREKAALGADAEQFTTNEDAIAFGESDGDLLNEADPVQSSLEFPSLPNLLTVSELPRRSLPGCSRRHPQGAAAHSGTSPITGPPMSYNSGYHTHIEGEEEPQVIKDWRTRRDEQIAKRSEQLAAQREKTIKEAQQNIDDFYENYNTKKERGIAQTREEAEKFQASQENTVSGGTSWDRIAKMIDVNGKGVKGGAAGSGKERFREALTALRKDDKAPGILNL